MSLIPIDVYIDDELKFKHVQLAIPEVHGHVPVTVTIDDTEYQITKLNWVYVNKALSHVALHLTDLPLQERATKALEAAGFHDDNAFSCWKSEKSGRTLLRMWFPDETPIGERHSAADRAINALRHAGLAVHIDGSTRNMAQRLVGGEEVQVRKLGAAPKRN